MTTKEATPKLYYWLLFASVVGLFSSAKLVLEKLSFWQQKAEGTAPLLGCDLNPIVGCGSVINTDQAAIFWSIPNPLLGVVAFSALGALSIVLLARIELPEWMWVGLQVGVVFGVALVTYLQYSSIYTLHALCPYCMVVWSIMIPTFWLVTRRNFLTWGKEGGPLRFIGNWSALLLSLHVLTILALIWFQFGTTLWA